MYNAGMVIRKEHIGERLKAARKRKGWTRFELSLQTRIPEPLLYRYESGRGKPSLENLIRLAKALEVSMDELIGLERKEANGDA